MRTMRFILLQMTESDDGPHTARKGVMYRPVLLLCAIEVASARLSRPRHMRRVSSLEVDSTRWEPAAHHPNHPLGAVSRVQSAFHNRILIHQISSESDQLIYC